MDMPYESTGRTRQKARTRDALLDGARTLLDAGATPTVEHVADAAGVSRTTAYRYFPDQRTLLLAAIPAIDRRSHLGADAPQDVAQRLDIVIRAQIEILQRYETQLRAALRLSLDQPAGTPRDQRPALRQGRAIGWIEEALAPLAATHPDLDRRRLAIAIRAGCGIEAWIWIADVAGVPPKTAATLMRESAQALLNAAISA